MEVKTHSHFSLHYGILSPEEIVQWAKSTAYSYVVLTDINATGAVLAFVREAQRLGIKPIVGVELRNGMEHVATLIARNNRGFHEMNHFLSRYLQTKTPFPRRLPHFTSCYTCYPIERVNFKLNQNEYIEIQGESLANLMYKYTNFSREKMLFLQPMTFRNKRDFNTHRLLRAIHLNTLLSKLPTTQQAPSTELFGPLSLLEENVKNHADIYEQTLRLFDTCHVSFAFGDEAMPQNPISYTGSKEEDELLLRELCAEGLDYRYPTLTDEIVARIEKEIAIISEKHYLSYFLITWDFCSYARSKGYFYVGRGSGANSIVAYLLRITDVDPLELDLYFERFINLYRKNPPDFDIDFSWKDRDDVVNYLFEKYPNAAWLCTYNTFQFRATIRELGKVFGLPKSEIDVLCSGKFRIENLDEISKLVIKYSEQIKGLPSHLSVHSGGIVISERPMTWYSGLFLPPKGFPTTQFSMLEAEDVGLYKFDILSQRGLGKIHDTLDVIAYNQPENPPHDIHDIHYFKKDKKIEQLLVEAKALGCFYVESPAMRMLMTKLQVKTYLELVAASSIIRPGVSQSGMMREYILRHRNASRRAEANPILVSIMPETYGVMVYQEDVIKVAHLFADLSLAEADVLRRGMSGKFRSREEFQRVRDTFFENCLRKGYSLELAADVWRQIESFAGYAFSKGHSASYAVESYQSLYLKAYYPLEYMTATINNFGGYYRTEIYVHEARRFGAKIEAPSVNFGAFECTLIGQRLIIGFNLVAGIEVRLIQQLMEERGRRGVFLDFDDLMRRLVIPLEQLSLMIRIGALRDFPESRKELLWKAHFYHHSIVKKPKLPELFAVTEKQFKLPVLDEQLHEQAFEQLELLGFPLCNPFDLLAYPLPSHTLASEMPNKFSAVVEMYGYLVTIKNSKTASGTVMNFGTLIDKNGDTIDSVHFPESVRKYPFFGKGVYFLKGRITEEFGYYCLEVGEMRKIPFKEDVRFEELNPQRIPSQN
ncbi:MAG: DNA polymerase III subunit alpha [Bacteroidetes bacterium]|nr:DNA polymerase III subunit alpha [Bacteroidota bacterium]